MFGSSSSSTLSQALFGSIKELETPIDQIFGQYSLAPTQPINLITQPEASGSGKEIEASESGYESEDESEGEKERMLESEEPQNTKEKDGTQILKELEGEEEDDENTKADKKQQIRQAKEKLKPGETIQMRENRTIFVGNLPVQTKKKALQTLFKSYGTIDSIRFRSIGFTAERKPIIGKLSQGAVHEFNDTKVAYIVFSEIESAKAALAANNTILQNNHIRVDIANNSSKLDHKNCVFVGNLPRDTKEEGLREHFEKEIGSVVSVRVIRDRNHINCKGFGFVKFKDNASFKACLGLDKQTIYQERPLNIVAAKKAGELESSEKSKSRVVGRSFIFDKKVKLVEDELYGAEKRIFEKKRKQQEMAKQDQIQNKRKRTDQNGNPRPKKPKHTEPQNADPTQKYKRFQKKIRSQKKTHK